MRVIFMGTPPFAVPSLELLILNQYQVVAVYTQPDRPSGRGRHPGFSAVKRAAVNLGLPVVQPATFREEAAVAQMAGFQPDIIVVAAYGQILPPAVLDIPPYGCVNIHPSLLPRYRGASPVVSPILAGDDFTGVSIMLLDRGLDTGPLLARAPISIAAQDTTGSLTDKLSRIAAQLLLEVLSYWLRDELTPQPQNEAEASYSRLISKKDGEIDWQMPAVALWRRLRAFSPWPGCYTRWQGRQLKVIEAVPLPADSGLEVGQVVARGGDTLGISTGDGILGVLKVQVEGRRVMTAAEFLRGQRNFIGARLPSNEKHEE